MRDRLLTAQFAGVPSMAALYVYHWRPQLQPNPPLALTAHKYMALLTVDIYRQRLHVTFHSTPSPPKKKKFQSLLHEI